MPRDRLQTVGRLAAGVASALLLATPATAIDLNRATRAQLEQLDGIGVSMAERLLQERAKAPFASWDELQQRVKGMGGKRAEQLRRQGVTIGDPAAAEVGRKDGK